MSYGVDFGMVDEETPEERRMRLLREMNPFTPRPNMGEQGSIDSGFPMGMAPQGGFQPDRPAWQDVQPRAPAVAGPAWRDPGSDGPPNPYKDPPVGGLLATKTGEPPKPEMDGILFGGTRSTPGFDALASAQPRASLQTGPEVTAGGIDVTGANGSDRNNVPRSPDTPANAMPPAPGSVPTPSRSAPRAVVIGGTTPPAPVTTARPAGAAPSQAPAGSFTLPQPQAAAVADGLSRQPGSPDAMNWLKENSDLFIALGAGLLSGKNIGEGILMGLRAANEGKVASAKQKELDRKNQAAQLQTATNAAMVKQAYGDKVSNEQAIVIAQTPAMMNEVFKSQFPSEQWQQVAGQNGQPGYLRNARTGDIKSDPSQPGASTPDEVSQDLVTPEQRRAHGIPESDKGLYKWSQKSGLQGVGQAKQYPSPEEAAQTAERTARISGATGSLNKLADQRLQTQGQIGMLNRLDELLGQIDTGGKTQALENFRKSTGIALDKNADKVQAASAAAEKIALGLHEAGTGTITDRDMESFRQQIPSLMGTPEGNKLVSDTLRGVAEHHRDAAEVAAKWRSGKMSLDQAQEAMGSLKDPFARMRDYQASRTPAAPAGAPAGAPAPSASGPVRIYDPKTRSFR